MNGHYIYAVRSWRVSKLHEKEFCVYLGYFSNVDKAYKNAEECNEQYSVCGVSRICEVYAIWVQD